ncbi:MAG TPA: nucleoside/nucleotide kinase family protein [Clostridiaceae bacterium]|nr:nucleoside/nucleotide kinase family protein [Clostridiaceae bacterium]
MNVQLNVNGFEYEASFTKDEVDNICIPILQRITEIRKRLSRRAVVFLTAPPAVGKSTLSLFLEKLSHEIKGVIPIQSLSLDGFHYPNDYLKKKKIVFQGKEHYLYEIKGMPETFDLDKCKSYLKRIKNENIRWPIYDRNIHDVVMDQILVEEQIVLVEGNWLLLDERGWRDLKQFCDYSIFISPYKKVLKDRLIHRKMKGGLNYKEALNFYIRSDSKNIERVMEHRLKADLELIVLKTGLKIKKDEED